MPTPSTTHLAPPAPRAGVLATLANWLLSVVLHTALLFLIASNLRGCEQGSGGLGDEDFREVGVVMKNSSPVVDTPAEDPVESTANSPVFSSTSDSAPQVVEDQPPVDLLTPASQSPLAVIGAGPLPSSPASSRVEDMIKPSGAFQPIRPGGLAKGETSFFDIRDKATRFVYLLDASGSMGGAPIRVAKAELLASLRSLDATQQFQVIFYNQTPRPMRLKGAARAELYWASNINQTLASQDIAGVTPSGGTSHVPALKLALGMSPEVIFFLTDADEPRLSAADLNDIKQMNKGRTRIHCIEFGSGPELAIDNFLKRLARENGGTYRYRDTTKFETR